MDLSKLLKKPKIIYTPEQVILPEPEPVPQDLRETYQSTNDYVADVKAMLTDEIANLDNLIDAVLEAVGPVDAPVPEEMQDLIGKDTVNMSDYLESLASEEYGPIAVREVFEEHLSESDPSGLTISILDDMRHELMYDLEFLSDDLFSGNFDPAGASDKALFAIRTSVAESIGLRREVARASELAGKAIDKALWAHVLQADGAIEFRNRAEEMASSLKRIQGLLKMGTSLYSLDWKSAVGNLRDRLKGVLMDQMMRRMFSSYNRAYNKIAAPLEPVLRFLGDSRASDIEEVQYLKELISKPLDDIASKASEISTDLYAVRKQKSELRVNGARTVGMMAYTWRLTEQLDLVLSALTGLSGGGVRLQAEAPQGAIGKLINDKRSYQLSPTEKVNLAEGAPSYDELVRKFQNPR